MKKLIERNLPLADRYTLEGITHLERGTVACENCGRDLSNVATISNAAGAGFNVGLECVKTLLDSFGNYRETERMLKDFEQTMRFLKYAAYADKVDDTSPIVRAAITNAQRKGSRQMLLNRSFLDRFDLTYTWSQIVQAKRGTV